MHMILVATLAFVAAYGPKGYISRRQGKVQTECRCAFPDMMDLLVVCVDAGLSLEAAIDRIGSEIAGSSRVMALNLALTSSEIRAGRSTIEALQHFADRVGIEEATSLVTLLRQSAELGASISQALKVYSEEMRDRRMSRAEERAHALPAKLVLPLALFIFPVILVIALYPVLIRIMAAFATMNGAS
jgi:tight adherence protein C